MRLNGWHLFAATWVALLNLHCGNSSPFTSSLDSYDTTTSVILGESIAGVASYTDDSTGLNVAKTDFGRSPRFNVFDILLPRAFATATTCDNTPSAKVQQNSCTGADLTLSFGGCTTSNGATWSGSMALNFGTQGVCQTAVSGGMMAIGTGSSVTMTSPSPGLTRVWTDSESMENDSDTSGYGSPVSGGIIMTCNVADCSTASGSTPGRTVQVLGLHRAEYTPQGFKVYDHTLNTNSPNLSISGVGSTRTIASGGVFVLQHNLLLYTATSTIESPLTFSGTCCWPTGGEITTVYSGSKTGTETLTFGSTCGSASVNGNPVSFLHCD